MQQTVAEFVGGTGELLFDLLITSLLTLAGVHAELFGVHTYPTDTTLALWAAFMGAVALYAGVVVFGGRRLLPRLRGAAAE